MAIFQIAEYQVKPEAIDRVKQAAQEFVHYVETNEPGTLLYSAWQQQDDPTHFTHFFIFEDDAAKNTHSRSNAVKSFESVYSPELVGRVRFTNYEQVATNQWLQTAAR
jgi:quinol monooxygenase YgiN